MSVRLIEILPVSFMILGVGVFSSLFLSVLLEVCPLCCSFRRTNPLLHFGFWFLFFLFSILLFMLLSVLPSFCLHLAYFSLSSPPPRLLITDFPSCLMRTFSDTNFFLAVFHLCLTNYAVSHLSFHLVQCVFYFS